MTLFKRSPENPVTEVRESEVQKWISTDFQVLGLDLITSIYTNQCNFKSDF